MSHTATHEVHSESNPDFKHLALPRNGAYVGGINTHVLKN